MSKTPVSPQQIDFILEKYSQGEGLRRAIADMGLTAAIFYRFLRENPDYATAYTQAREVRGEMMVDKAFEVANSDDNPMKVRTQVDLYKWYASKVVKEYGDRIDVNVAGQVDIRAAIEDGRKRFENRRVIDVTHIVEQIPERTTDDISVVQNGDAYEKASAQQVSLEIEKEKDPAGGGGGV